MPMKRAREMKVELLGTVFIVIDVWVCLLEFTEVFKAQKEQKEKFQIQCRSLRLPPHSSTQHEKQDFKAYIRK